MKALESELEARIEKLGFEFVELERAGTKTRPVFRLRIDRPGATPGNGVTIGECADVSRALRSFLDEEAELKDQYRLEVSSPGVERPLVRPSDFERFAGRRALLRGYAPLAGRDRRLEGELLGLVDERIRLRLDDGEEVEVPRDRVARAQLVFRWDDVD